MAADPRTPPPITPAKAVVLLVAQGALLTAAGVGLWRLAGRELGDFLSFSWAELALGLGFAAILILSAAALFHAFPRISESLVRMQADTYRFLGPNLGWAAIILISLTAGISEEAALRGGLQTLFADHLGIWTAIGVSSAVFAVLHLAKPIVTALLFAIGILFGVAYWQTGSLLAVMIAHVLYDIWALRYLNREMHRLGLFDESGSDAADAPLAKEAAPG